MASEAVWAARRRRQAAMDRWAEERDRHQAAGTWTEAQRRASRGPVEAATEELRRAERLG